MATKLHLFGLLEVEGDEKVVLQVYEDLKDVIKDRIATAGQPTEPHEESGEPSTNGEPIVLDKKRRNGGRRSGPSCASRILELKDVDFFKELRDTKTVADTLSTRGHNYEGKHIAAALINLTKRGTIRRVKKDGSWMYQNP